MIEQLVKPIKAAFFVSGFVGLLGNPAFDAPNESFIMKPFVWKKIGSNCKKFYVINSDNDPYVPLEKGKELASFLRTELIVVKNAGHINAESGHTTFEFLLEKIKKEL